MRAKVIEGNLSLQYRTRQLCSPGEWLAVRLLRGFILHDLDDTCSDATLGLGGKPDAHWIEVRPQPGGEVILQARLPDRDRSFPLLTVTAEDARVHGTTPEQLAPQWASLLQRQLRFARRILTPTEIWGRWLRVALIELVLAAVRPPYPLASGELRISRSLLPRDGAQGMTPKGLRSRDYANG